MSNLIPPSPKQEESWQFIFEQNDSYLQAKNKGFAQFKRQFIPAKPSPWQQVQSATSGFFAPFLRPLVFAPVTAILLLAIGFWLLWPNLNIGQNGMQTAQNDSSSANSSGQNGAPQDQRTITTNNSPTGQVAGISSEANSENNSQTNSFSDSENAVRKSGRFTALSADPKNNVTSLDSCDLGLKFPKEVGGQAVEVSQVQVAEADNNLDLQPVGKMILGPKPKQNTAVYNFAIDCYKMSDKDKFLGKKAGYKFIGLSKEQLKEVTGWHLTEAEVSNIAEYQFPNLEDNRRHLIFEHKDTFNHFSFVEKSVLEKQSNLSPVSTEKNLSKEQNKQIQLTLLATENSASSQNSSSSSASNSGQKAQENQVLGLTAQDLQMQFNSLAENQPNVTPQLVDSKIEPLFPTLEREVVVMNTCNLAVGYPREKVLSENSLILGENSSAKELILTTPFLKNGDKPIVKILCSDKPLDKTDALLKEDVKPEKPYFLDSDTYKTVENYRTHLAFGRSETLFNLEKGEYSAQKGEKTRSVTTFKYGETYYRIELNLFDQDPQKASYAVPQIQIQLNSLAPSVASKTL